MGAMPVMDRVPTPMGTVFVQDFAVLIVCFKLGEYISSVNQRLLFKKINCIELLILISNDLWVVLYPASVSSIFPICLGFLHYHLCL